MGTPEFIELNLLNEIEPEKPTRELDLDAYFEALHGLAEIAAELTSYEDEEEEE